MNVFMYQFIYESFVLINRLFIVIMNKSRYFTRDHVKLISPSTQMLALENKDISFFVKHYGNTQDKFTESKLKQLEENAKYFMGQVQPLLDENSHLKDTIINLSQALKYAQELVIELVRKEDPSGQSRELRVSLGTMEQLTCLVKDDLDYDDAVIHQLQHELQDLKDICDKLKLQIAQLSTANEAYAKSKDEELESKIKYYRARDDELVKQCTALEEQIQSKDTEQLGMQATIDKQDKQIQFLHAQIIELKKKIEEVQRNIVTQDKKYMIEKQEQYKKFTDEIRTLKQDHARETGDLRGKYQGRISEMQAELKDKDERLEELDTRLRDEMRKSGWEIQQLALDYKKICLQFEELKNHEINQLDKMAQLMIEKREMEGQLTSAEEKLAISLEDLRQSGITILDNQKRIDELEQSYKQQIFDQSQAFKLQLNSIIAANQETKKNEQNKFMMEIQKLKQDHEEETHAINLSKAARVEELQTQIQSLIHQIQDLHSDMKAQDDMWNFKYVTMEVKMQRQIHDVETSAKSEMREHERKWKIQQETSKKDMLKHHQDEIVALDERFINLKNSHSRTLMETEDKFEAVIVGLRAQLTQQADEFSALQKRSMEQIQKLQHENEGLLSKIRNQQMYHEDQILQLESNNNEKLQTAQKTMMRQIQMMKEGYEQRFESLQKDFYKVQSSLDAKSKENEINIIQSRSVTPQQQWRTEDKSIQTNEILIVEISETLQRNISREELLEQENSLLHQQLQLEIRQKANLQKRINQLELDQHLEVSKQSVPNRDPESRQESETGSAGYSRIGISMPMPVASGRISEARSNQEVKANPVKLIETKHQDPVRQSEPAKHSTTGSHSSSVQGDNDQKQQQKLQHKTPQQNSNQRRSVIQSISQPKRSTTKAAEVPPKIQEFHSKTQHHEPTLKSQDFEFVKTSEKSLDVSDKEQQAEKQVNVLTRKKQSKATTKTTQVTTEIQTQVPTTRYEDIQHPILEVNQTHELLEKNKSMDAKVENENGEKSIKQPESSINPPPLIERPKSNRKQPQTLCDQGTQTQAFSEMHISPQSLEASQNSFDLFDNQTIMDRIRQEYDSKFQQLKASINDENVQLQQYVEQIQKESSSKQEEYKKQVDLLKVELDRLKSDQPIGQSRGSNEKMQLRTLLNPEQEQELNKLKEDNNSLRQEIYQFRHDEVPRVVGYYEHQLDALRKQLQKKDLIIGQISKHYESQLTDKLGRLEAKMESSHTQRSEEPRPDTGSKKTHQSTGTEHNIQEIINRSVRLEIPNQQDSIRNEFETFKQIQQYKNSLFMEEHEQLKHQYTKLKQEKDAAEERLKQMITHEHDQGSQAPNSEAYLRPILQTAPAPKFEKNFLSKINREFQTHKSQLANDLGEQFDLSNFIDYQTVKQNYPLKHPSSPIQPKFINNLRPRAKLDISDSWEKLPNYFVDQTTREIKTNIHARDRGRHFDPEIPLLTNLYDQTQRLSSDENQKAPKGYWTSQLKSRGTPLEDILRIRFECDDTVVQRTVDHFDPRVSLQSKQLSQRPKAKALIRRKRHPSAEQMKDPGDLKIEGIGRGESQQRSRTKNPGFIEYLKMKKDGDKVKNYKNYRGTSPEDIQFLKVQKAGSGFLE